MYTVHPPGEEGISGQAMMRKFLADAVNTNSNPQSPREAHHSAIIAIALGMDVLTHQLAVLLEVLGKTGSD